MKKLISPIIILFLLCFSFFYTNKVVDTLKETDPIMKEIKKTNDYYKIESVNAKIIGNNIIPGVYGEEIDYEESYSNMKKYGTYNESLTTTKKVKPTISIEDNYDKYLVKGNNLKRNISFIFIVKDEDINNIINILDKEETPATFFIDGTYLEKNISLIKNMTSHEIELLSYNNTYDKSFFKTSLSYLESITGKDTKYCYTKKNNKELLNLCSKLKLHTIKPTITVDKNLYRTVKNNLTNSIIIEIKINKYNEKELKTTINYLKSKDYNITTLDNLLKEN